MIALGVDISTRKLAIAGIRADASITTHALMLDATRRGGRRLTGARSAAFAVFAGYAADCCACLIELPWRGENYRIATVVEEAAQAAMPGAVVMTCAPTTWKLEILGHGHATKLAALEFAAVRGYQGTDDDIAEALCMADAAWSRWRRDVEAA